jgi:aspartate/methionine/tyrosine aminotransferase
MGQRVTGSGISYSTAQDVERIWINPGQEYSHRVVTTRRQVAVVPGASFGAAGEGHVRLSLAVAAPEFDVAVSRLTGALKGQFHLRGRSTA